MRFQQTAAIGILAVLTTTTSAIGQERFVLRTDDGAYRLQLSLLVQVDGRFAIDDIHNDNTDTFAIRRLRPIMQGTAARLFSFLFTPDLAGGAVNIRDAYVDTALSPKLRIRVGKAKTAFSLERLHSAASLTFVERAFPATVAPDRDIGLQVLGDLSRVVSYQAGLFNGVIDGGSSDRDVNDGKDLAARVVVRPFAVAKTTALNGLGLALAGSYGEQPAELPSFRTSTLRTFFTYSAGTRGAGIRRRVSPQFFYHYKAVGAFGEYVRSRGDIVSADVSVPVDHTALSLSGSVVLTKALEIAARYHALAVDAAAASRGLGEHDAYVEANAFTVGANWYLNPSIKWVFNFERTILRNDINHARSVEHAILVRQQLSF